MLLSLLTGDGPKLKPQVYTKACVSLAPYANQMGWREILQEESSSEMLTLQSMLQGRKKNLVVMAEDMELGNLGLFLALSEP